MHDKVRFNMLVSELYEIQTVETFRFRPFTTYAWWI